MKKALWTLISQIPLVGGAAVLWKEVVKHPLAAIGIAVLYELFSFVLIFGSKVWKELEAQAVAGVAEWVKIAFLNFFSRFRRRYNRQVIYDHRVFNVRGLRTTGTYTLEVEKVFVELRIEPGHLQQAGVNPTAFKEVSGSQPVWEFLRRMKVTFLYNIFLWISSFLISMVILPVPFCLIMTDENITREGLSEKIGISIRNIEKNIAALKVKGLLKRIGPDKTGYWKVEDWSNADEKDGVNDGLKDGVSDGVKDGVILSETQEKILNLIMTDENITRKGLSEKIGISIRNIEKNIAALKEKGLLKRIGPDKTGYWKVEQGIRE